LGPSAWRWMYLVGVLPALLVLWIWRGMPESGRWEAASEQRRAARELRRRGAPLNDQHAALTRFTVVDMFLDRSIRGRLVGAFLMMLSVTLGFWGVATPSCRPTSAQWPPRPVCRHLITLPWLGCSAPALQSSALSASVSAPIGSAAGR